jgi:hypothetical protein
MNLCIEINQSIKLLLTKDIIFFLKDQYKTDRDLLTMANVFDKNESKERIKEALEKLQSESEPEAVELANRTDIIRDEEVKQDILKLVDAGYTPVQIAKAISNDVFQILPRSITSLINAEKDKKKKKRIAKKTTVEATIKPQEREVKKEVTTAKTSGAFLIDEDPEL